MSRGNVCARVGDPLTRLEMSILMAIADGDTGREMAVDLGVNYETVRYFAANVKTKLGARTMAHAVAQAYHQGILRPAGLKVAA